MKILYCAMKYDYGDPKRGGYSLEHYNFYESLVNYQNGVHAVTYFAFDEVMLAVGKEKMNAQLISLVNSLKPDLCFFVLFNNEIKKETLSTLKNIPGLITYNWFCDDHWRFHNFSKHYAPLFHFVSTTDHESLGRYRDAGITNVLKTQWAVNPSIYKPYPGEYTSDVSFIGQPYGERPLVIESLRKSGISVDCFGPGWPAGRIWGEEMVRKFSQSKINLNFAKSSGSLNMKSIAQIFINKDKDGQYHMNPPASWIDEVRALGDRLHTCQIKTRNFEVPGSGGLLMTDYADNLSEYFVPEKEIVIYNNVNDLIEKCRYYLSHDKEREEIRERGYSRAIKEQKYSDRFDALFSEMKVNSFNP